MSVPPRKIIYYAPLKRIDRKPKSHYVAFCFAIFGVILAVSQVLRYVSVVSNNRPMDSKLGSYPTPTPYYKNIALLGYGGGGHDGGALTDSVIVARIDDRAKKVFLISFPRDLWVGLPIDKGGKLAYWKLNSAYAMGLDDAWYSRKPTEYQSKNGGGGNLAKYALGDVLGEKIDHFAAVSFKAFSILIDSLGGITITRTTTFTDAWYPTDGKEKDTCDKSEDDLKAIEATMSGYLKEQEFKCRYETLSLGTGTHTLDGETALKYVRSRHSESEGGDFYRSQRQRQVVNAIKDKALNIAAVPKLIELATSMQKYVDTDYRVQDIPSIIQLLMSKKEYEIESIALTNENVLKDGAGPNGEYILIPKTGKESFTPVQQFLQDRFDGMSEASASAKFAKLLISPTSVPTTGVKKLK